MGSKKRNTTTEAAVLEPIASVPGTQLVVVEQPPVVADNDPNLSPEEEALAQLEIEEQVALPNSVVRRAYKLRYKERARARGDKGKAAKRSNWDWLAQAIARDCLDKKAKMKVEAFLDLLAANGIEDALERWPSQSPGWEGRLRMTGRLALQAIVAETGVLMLPGGDYLEAPEEWVAKHRS